MVSGQLLVRFSAESVRSEILAHNGRLLRFRVDFWVMANRFFITKWSIVQQPEGFPIALWTPSALLRLFLDLY
jgi:hypothetical protein